MSTDALSGRHPAVAADDMFDSLADLFLGDQPTSAAHPVSIETRGLIVGHLPIIASAWIAQHARDLAKQLQGPVAVVARSGGHLTIDLVGITHRLDKSHTVEQAIDCAMTAGVRAWLLRTDAVSELALAESTSLDGLSILTGHDEAALVGAYRAMKGLTNAGSDFEPAVPDIHIAVMGASDQQGRPAAEKLRRAAESFLQTGLASVSFTDKIGAGTAARLYDGPYDPDIDQLLSTLPTEHKPAETAPPKTTPKTTMPNSQTPAQAHLRLAHPDNASRIGPIGTNQAPAEQQPSTHQAPVATVIPQQQPASDAHAHLLGLTTLEPRCPYADEVELAADAEGRAHLIVHAQGPSHALAGALESLEIARAWLSAHLTLLAAATQDTIRANPPLDPATHLIVDHAPGARRLLDSNTRVYVLAAGRSETLCVPLN